MSSLHYMCSAVVPQTTFPDYRFILSYTYCAFNQKKETKRAEKWDRDVKAKLGEETVGVSNSSSVTEKTLRRHYHS